MSSYTPRQHGGGWNSRRSEGARSSGYRHQNGDGRPGFPRVDLPIQAQACGYFVGAKGRNIKELQGRPDIQYIRLDSGRGVVSVEASEAGLAEVERRTRMASSKTVQESGYFPELTYACLHSVCSSVQFRGVDACGTYPVSTAQLHVDRHYFVIESNEIMDNVVETTDLDDSALPEATLDIGFRVDKCKTFFLKVITTPGNLAHLQGTCICATIAVNFGKTVLSSVPPEYMDGTEVSMAALRAIPFGKKSLQPEFLRHLVHSRGLLMASKLLDGYGDLAEGRFIMVHCVSERDKKRYSIKLKYRDGEDSDGFPQVVEFRSKGRKLGLVTLVQNTASRVEFRTRLETECQAGRLPLSLEQRLEEAWRNRTPEGKLQFPRDNEEDDWLTVEAVRYKTAWQYRKGCHSLTVGEETEDYFGQNSQGVSLSLKIDERRMTNLLQDSGNEELSSALVDEIGKLQEEAARIASVLDNL